MAGRMTRHFGRRLSLRLSLKEFLSFFRGSR